MRLRVLVLSHWLSDIAILGLFPGSSEPLNFHRTHSSCVGFIGEDEFVKQYRLRLLSKKNATGMDGDFLVADDGFVRPVWEAQGGIGSEAFDEAL